MACFILIWKKNYARRVHIIIQGKLSTFDSYFENVQSLIPISDFNFFLPRLAFWITWAKHFLEAHDKTWKDPKKKQEYIKTMWTQLDNVRTLNLCIINPFRCNFVAQKRSFTLACLSQYMFALNGSEPRVEMWFYTVGLQPQGIEQLWMFFLQIALDLISPGVIWPSLPGHKMTFLGLLKIRVGMPWCNAGRERRPSWLMAAQIERDPWSHVCFTCGWDAVSPETWKQLWVKFRCNTQN